MSRLVLFTPLLFATALGAQSSNAPFTLYDRSGDLTYSINSAINTNFSVLNQHSTAYDRLYGVSSNLAYSGISGFGSFTAGPVAWAQQDVADSLYRSARDQLNRGDYRKAAALFKSLPQKYPNSAYAADAQYWQAFALYRVGTTAELQEALTVLEAMPKTTAAGDATNRNATASGINGRGDVRTASTRAPATVTSSINGDSRGIGIAYASDGLGGMRRGQTQADAAALSARIANVLSSRGMADNAAVKRALAAGGNSCDQEDQSVRAEALSALMQNDAEMGRQMASKILANTGECSVPLRRNAVLLLSNKGDASANSVLIGVAKNDPSNSVRMAAMHFVIQHATPEGNEAILQMLRSDDAQIQRAALSALGESNDPKVRTEIRTLIENNGTAESLRVAALDSYDRDRMSAEDATWLRNLYARSTSARVKERIINAVSRAGGDANNQWLISMVKNEDEPLDSRAAALNRAGRTMDLKTLVATYDASSQRPIRETVVQLLSERKEPEALDKLVDIAKNGTDPSMRRMAISALARSKDPRASKLLLQLVDK